MKYMDIFQGHFCLILQVRAMDVQTKFSIYPLNIWLITAEKWIKSVNLE